MSSAKRSIWKCELTNEWYVSNSEGYEIIKYLDYMQKLTVR